MSYILLNYVFKNDIFLLFSRIYDVIKIIVISYFFVNSIFENDILLLFLRIRNNYDIMFFVNCVFKNDIFMYIL